MFGSLMGAGACIWTIHLFQGGVLYDPVLMIYYLENVAMAYGFILCMITSIYFGLKAIK